MNRMMGDGVMSAQQYKSMFKDALLSSEPDGTATIKSEFQRLWEKMVCAIPVTFHNHYDNLAVEAGCEGYKIQDEVKRAKHTNRLVEYLNGACNVHTLREVLNDHLVTGNEPQGCGQVKFLEQAGQWNLGYAQTTVRALGDLGIPSFLTLPTQFRSRLLTFLNVLVGKETGNEWGTSGYVKRRLSDIQWLNSDDPVAVDVTRLLFGEMFVEHVQKPAFQREISLFVEIYNSDDIEELILVKARNEQTLDRVLTTYEYGDAVKLAVLYGVLPDHVKPKQTIRPYCEIDEMKVVRRLVVPVESLHRMYLHSFYDMMMAGRQISNREYRTMLPMINGLEWQFSAWMVEQGENTCPRLLLTDVLVQACERQNEVYEKVVDLVLDQLEQDGHVFAKSDMKHVFIIMDCQIDFLGLENHIDIKAIKLLGRLKLDERVQLANKVDPLHESDNKIYPLLDEPANEPDCNPVDESCIFVQWP